MRRHLPALVLVGIAAGAAQSSEASAGRKPPERGDEATIRALRAANNHAIAARDADAAMSIAADDYVLVAGGDTIFRSADAMRARWTATFADQGQRGCVRHPETIEVGHDGGVDRAARKCDLPRMRKGPEDRSSGPFMQRS